jgi:hypothetical protein
MLFTYIVFEFKVVCISGYMNVCKILLLCTVTANLGVYKLKPYFDVPSMHNFSRYYYRISDLSARQRKHYLSSYSFVIKNWSQ